MGLSLGLGLDLGRRGGRTGGGAGVWLPSSLTGYVGSPHSVAYFRSLGTLWQDTAKTIPAAADGDPVRVAVCDGVDWTAPTDAARPLLWDEGGGLWSFYFDGVDDELTTAFGSWPSTAGTASIAFVRDEGENGVWTLNPADNGGGSGDFYSYFTAAYVGNFRGTRLDAPFNPPDPATPRVYLQLSGADYRCYVGASLLLTTAADWERPSQVSLGRSVASNNTTFMAGRVYGAGLFSDALSDTDRATLTAYQTALIP
jgi:hypothetical protein